ncbi:class I SAM-dependent methyltransferase [soil metagenome]
MENRSRTGATHEEACARVAALFPQLPLRMYVGSKLRSDPVFRIAFEWLRGNSEPLLDIGCGVGLLPFYLRERGFSAPITGFDLDARKVFTATQVGARHYSGLTFAVGDVAADALRFRGSVAMLDVLHYLSYERQATLLVELAASIAPGGLLLLRDSPREQSARYWCTYAGEAFAQAVSWNLGLPLNFPAREEITAGFPPDEFAHEELPTWGSTPFNNRLFVFRRGDTPVA